MATPVVAGAFALAKAADADIPILQWLDFMKQSGTLIDDVIIRNIPRLNIQAALELSGSLAPPSNVIARWPTYTSVDLTWSAPNYGPQPTGYRITINGVTTDVSGSTFSFTGPLLAPDTSISVSSLLDSSVSSAVYKIAMPTSRNVSRVSRVSSNYVESALLGGDECTAPVSKKLVVQYDSPTFANRSLLLLDGQGDAQILTETKPSPLPPSLTSLYAKQIVINNPQDVVKSTSALYFVNSNGEVGVPYSLTRAFNLMLSSPSSPSPVTNLQVVPGVESAQISWSDASSSAWRVIVDGVQRPNVVARSLALSLAAGSHSVAVCAVKSTSNGEYSSVRQEATFTVSNKLSQTISASAPETFVLSAGNASISASSTSGLGLSFSSLTSSVCSVNASGVLTALQGGTCSVRVSQAGNAQYLEATPATVNVRILLPQSIVVGTIGNKTWGDAAFALDAVSTVGRDLTFSTSTPSVCLVGSATGVVSLIGAGQCRIDVTQVGAPNYVDASEQIAFTVLRPKSTVVRTVKATVSARKITLSWNAPANSTKAGVTKYVIKYRVGTKGAWKSVTITSRLWQSPTFAKGVRVYFTITASGARGSGDVFAGNRLIS
jgi:hypothetical protein